MSILTNINRRESNEKTEEIRPILYARILSVMSEEDNLTANEIAKRINPNWRRQDVQPRLNELRDEYGFVEEVGKKYDNETKRNVTAYKLVDKMVLDNQNHIPHLD